MSCSTASGQGNFRNSWTSASFRLLSITPVSIFLPRHYFAVHSLAMYQYRFHFHYSIARLYQIIFSYSIKLIILHLEISNLKLIFTALLENLKAIKQFGLALGEHDIRFARKIIMESDSVLGSVQRFFNLSKNIQGNVPKETISSSGYSLNHRAYCSCRHRSYKFRMLSHFLIERWNVLCHF